jgi:hypothetical protein
MWVFRMTDELKTLKGICKDTYGCCCKEKLRIEAIKWYKMEESDIRGWIKYFFNITEEDLKDE